MLAPTFFSPPVHTVHTPQPEILVTTTPQII